MEEQERRERSRESASVYPRDMARIIADELARGEDEGWTYRMEDAGTEGWFVIAIYDGDGVFVGYWGGDIV